MAGEFQIDRDCVIDDSGRLHAVENGEPVSYFLHAGVRVAIGSTVIKDCAGVDPATLIVRALGGHTADQSFEENAMAFTLTANGARCLALDLLDAANLLDPVTTIDRATLDAQHDAAVRRIREHAGAIEQGPQS